MGEGRHRHPLLTAGPQQLVQHGQRVQAYLENQVGEEEEDAGPQQSFEDAAGVTCETWATCHPAPKDTSNPSRVSAPSGRAGKGALCTEIPRLCPRVRIPPGLCPPHRAPSTAQGHPESQSPGPPSLPPCVPAAPSWHFPGPAGQGAHRDAVSIPMLLERPVGGLQGSPPPQTPSALPPAAAVPPSHPALRALCPFSWPGGGVGSEPTTAASRPRGGPGPAAFPPLVFSCKSTRKLSAAPGSGAVRAHEIFRG